MMEAKRTILAFNLGQERTSALRKAALPLGCTVKSVDKRSFARTVGALAGCAGYSTDKTKKPQTSFDGAFIVICGYSGAGLDIVLSALRSAGIGADVLKAVLTPTNAAWDCVSLYNEVRAESDSLRMRN